MSRPRYISAVLTLKPERRRRTEGEGRGAGQRVVGSLGGAEGRRKGREEGGRKEGEGEGRGVRRFMKTQPPTLRPLLPEVEQDKRACLRARAYGSDRGRHSSARWMPSGEARHRQNYWGPYVVH